MKQIRINIPSVEEAMLIEVQKKNKKFLNLESLILEYIRQEYQRNKQ